MSKDITEALTEDLYQKTRSQLNTFLDETNALLAAGDALNEDRTSQAHARLKAFLAEASAPIMAHEPAAPIVTRALAETKSYVKANPWAAVGAAAGLGLVVSLLLKRRNG